MTKSQLKEIRAIFDSYRHSAGNKTSILKVCVMSWTTGKNVTIMYTYKRTRVDGYEVRQPEYMASCTLNAYGKLISFS